MSQASANTDLAIQRNSQVAWQDQLQVLAPHFPLLKGQADLASYFQGSALGDPQISLVYCQEKPAAHLAFFPFPLWADGRPIVAGKAECAARIERAFRRPELLGLAARDLIDRARNLRWPLLLAKTNARGRSSPSYRKSAARELPMPAAILIWPLNGEKLRAGMLGYLGKRSSRLASLTRGIMGGYVGCLGAKIFVFWPRLLAAWRHAAELRPMTFAELLHQPQLVETNYWPQQRLTVRRHLDFLRSRFTRPEDGYEFWAVQSREGQNGIILTRFAQGELSVLDFLPPALALRTEIWVALLRLAIGRRAGWLWSRLHLNDPVQAAVFAMLRQRLPTIVLREEIIYSILVLDERFSFAYDPSTWAGTEMLTAGF